MNGLLTPWNGVPASPSDVGRIVDLRPPGAFLELSDYYGGADLRIVEEVLAQAYGLGAQMAVVEYRYQDFDGGEAIDRSSTAPSEHPASTHRIHFFVEPPTDELEALTTPYDFGDLTYLGFTVMQVHSETRVGQTLLAVPVDLRSDIDCQVDYAVEVFGYLLTVRTTPFLGISPLAGGRAAASLWMAATYHYEAFGTSRTPPLDVASILPSGLSAGLSVTQIAEGCNALGLAATVYDCRSLPADESIATVAQRYLGSGIPILVVAADRSLLMLIGAQAQRQQADDDEPSFIYHNVEVGPYVVGRTATQEWDYLIIPLPASVVVTAEVAFELGKAHLKHAFASDNDGEVSQLSEASARGELEFRSTLIRSDRFKTTLPSRVSHPLFSKIYRRLPLPRWVWVIEAIGCRETDNSPQYAVVDVVLDATASRRDLAFVTLRTPGELWIWSSGGETAGCVPTPPDSTFLSVSGYGRAEPIHQVTRQR